MTEKKMMKAKELPCEVVRDMLPSYIEGLVSEETAEMIRAHLATCEECRQAFCDMTDGDDAVAMALKEEMKGDTDRSVDYLKKVRGHARRNVIIAVLAVLLLAAYPMTRFFIVGSADTAAAYTLEVSEDASAMTITGTTLSSSESLARLTVSQDEKGVVTVTPHGVQPLFYHGDTRTADFTAEVPITEVRTASGQILWQEGKTISGLAGELSAMETPYVGDNSAMGNLLAALDLSTRLGIRDFQFSLQTEKEPYGMTVYSELPMTAKNDAKVMESKIRAISCVLLAKVDNLDRVTVTYLDARGEKHSVTVTASEATDFTGKDIKSWDDSAKSMQELLDLLGIAAL